MALSYDGCTDASVVGRGDNSGEWIANFDLYRVVFWEHLVDHYKCRMLEQHCSSYVLRNS